MTVPGDISNNFTATTCTPVNTGPTGVSSCVDITADATNNWTTTTCTPEQHGVDRGRFVLEHRPDRSERLHDDECQTINTGPTPVGSCSNSAAALGNAWTATSCTTVVVQPWTDVGTCTIDPPSAGNGYVATLCQTVNGRR
jgi:hypothetical protein